MIIQNLGLGFPQYFLWRNGLKARQIFFEKFLIFAKKKVLKPLSTCLQLIFWLFPCVPISQKIGFRVSIPPPAITLLASTKVEHSLKINGLCLRKLRYISSISMQFFRFSYYATLLCPMLTQTRQSIIYIKYSKYCGILLEQFFQCKPLILLKSMKTIILTYSVYSI